MITEQDFLSADPLDQTYDLCEYIVSINGFMIRHVRTDLLTIDLGIRAVITSGDDVLSLIHPFIRSKVAQHFLDDPSISFQRKFDMIRIVSSKKLYREDSVSDVVTICNKMSLA
jgi:hypothetical protein